MAWAFSGQIKNFRDGGAVASDDSGLTFDFECGPGDFACEDLEAGGYEVEVYLKRGRFGTLRETNQLFPKWSISAHMTQLLGFAGTGNRSLLDMILKKGGCASGQSTLGTASGKPWTFDLVYTLNGTLLGDGGNTLLYLYDNRARLSMKEGSPNSFNVAATAYGGWDFGTS